MLKVNNTNTFDIQLFSPATIQIVKQYYHLTVNVNRDKWHSWGAALKNDNLGELFMQSQWNFFGILLTNADV